jgi:hypothetical protein
MSGVIGQLECHGIGCPLLPLIATNSKDFMHDAIVPIIQSRDTKKRIRVRALDVIISSWRCTSTAIVADNSPQQFDCQQL